jgi:hypothetical protein
MNKLIGTIILISIHLNGYCQTRQDSIKNAFAFVDSLLEPGLHNYDIVDFEYPKDLQDLMIKMNNAIAANKQWYVDYAKKNYIPGEGIPYDTLFGITKDEFNRLKHIDTVQTILKVLASGKVDISKESNRVAFKSQGASALFDYIKIDLPENLMVLESDTISFDHFLHVTSNKRMGPWKGYIWSKKATNIMNTGRLEDTNAKMIDLIFGRLMEGQRFIRIKYQLIKKGETLANSDILFYLK